MPKVTVKLPNHAALVAGGSCAPCESRRLDAQTLAAAQLADASETPTSGDVRWEGVLCQEGIATGDGRFMSPGSMRWDTLPMPLRWDEFDDGEHAGAVVVGLIETVERRDNGDIWGTGTIDSEGKYGREVLRLMRKGMLSWVSVDMDDMDVEIRVKEELLKESDEAFAAMLSEPMSDDPADLIPERPPADDNGYVAVGEMAMDDELMVVLDTRIRAATLVDVAAFEGARLRLVEDGNTDPDLDDQEDSVEDDDSDEDEVLLAAAGPLAPPAAWFADPGFKGPSALTITDDGRVFGHIALWDSCHIGFSRCVKPPRSSTGYALFLTGDTVTAEGTHVNTGKYTFQTGHAPARASAVAAAHHYDNTGSVGADVFCGEDAHGIWVAGAVRSSLTPEQLRDLRAAPASGDWRDLGRGLELVGLLGVNIPGFPVPRPRALVAGGRVRSQRIPVPTWLESAPTETLPQAGMSPRLRKMTLLRKLKGN